MKRCGRIEARMVLTREGDATIGEGEEEEEEEEEGGGREEMEEREESVCWRVVGGMRC